MNIQMFNNIPLDFKADINITNQEISFFNLGTFDKVVLKSGNTIAIEITKAIRNKLGNMYGLPAGFLPYKKLSTLSREELFYLLGVLDNTVNSFSKTPKAKKHYELYKAMALNEKFDYGKWKFPLLSDVDRKIAVDILSRFDTIKGISSRLKKEQDMVSLEYYERILDIEVEGYVNPYRRIEAVVDKFKELNLEYAYYINVESETREYYGCKDYINYLRVKSLIGLLQ